MGRLSSFLLCLLVVAARAEAKGPRWTFQADGVEISVAGHPIGVLPPVTSLSETPSPEGMAAALAASGNLVFERIRDTQDRLSWFQGSVYSSDSSVTARWPDSPCAILLSDGVRADLVEVLAMRSCGPHMMGCDSLEMFPVRNVAVYDDIRVGGLEQCMVFLAFRIPTARLFGARISDLVWARGKE